MATIVEEINKRLSVPQYVKQFVDSSIDLEETPKICCIFPDHVEDTPSFSFSKERNKWRCFGKCKTGGDTIAMHQKFMKLASRDDAIKSLKSILKIDKVELDFSKRIVHIDVAEMEYTIALSTANNLCKSSKDYVDLDYIMSQAIGKNEVTENLKQFITGRGGIIHGEQ